MKKKLIIFLAAVLLIALSVGGTYAYKSTSLETHNVISSGKGVKVELVDLDTGDSSADTGRSVALPGDRSGGIYAVENIGGSDAWVRLRLVPDATPAAGLTTALDISKLSVEGLGDDWSDKDSEGWFYYTKPLKPGELIRPCQG